MRYTLVNTIEDIICSNETIVNKSHISIYFENENGLYVECFIDVHVSENYIDQKDYDLQNYYEYELDNIVFESIIIEDCNEDEIKLTKEEVKYLEEEVYKFVKSKIES